MATVLLTLVMMATPVDGSANDAPPRKFHEINADIRALFLRESRAEEAEEQAAAVREMTVVYREILRHPQLPTSPTLQSFKAKLWSRLTKIKGQLERQIKHAQRRRPASPGEIDEIEQATKGLAAQLTLIGQTIGGPGQVFSRGAFGGAAGPADNGQALVDLIQRTITPDFWDVNGGPGTIVYYAPLRVLVVRATGEQHHNVGNLVDGLR